MRFFTAVAAFGLVALASAQTSTNATEPATSTSAAAPVATTETATTKCLNACGAADLCCQAKCVGVPCPNDLQANQTTDCAAKCVQGNGTEEETASYAACQSSCISSLFFPLSATAGGAGATGTGAGSGEATATAAGTGIGGSSGSATQGGSATGTGSSGSASSTSNSGNSAAAHNGIAGAGLLGLVIAGLAL